MATNPRIRVYAWEFPVRLTHWTNVLSIIALCVTGYYIGSPFIHAHDSSQFVMGEFRYLHFVVAYVFMCSMAVRLYWAFAGNQHASWRAWFPFTGKRFQALVDTIKYYTFIAKHPPYAVGHTALAGVTYFFAFLLFGFQILSGFAMHSVTSQSAIAGIVGGWLLGYMDLQTMRILHHLAMWCIGVFVMIHLYISWWLDTAEKNGLMGSIFGGYKFVTGKEWE